MPVFYPRRSSERDATKAARHNCGVLQEFVGAIPRDLSCVRADTEVCPYRMINHMGHRPLPNAG